MGGKINRCNTDKRNKSKLYIYISFCNLFSLMIFRFIFSGELIWPKLPSYFVLYSLLWFILLNFHGYFDTGSLRRKDYIFMIPVKCALYALLFMMLSRFFPKVTANYMYINLIKNGFIFLLFAVFTVFVRILVVGKVRKKAVICGSYSRALHIIEQLAALDCKQIEITGIFTDDLPDYSDIAILGDESDCVSSLKKVHIDYVFLTSGRRDEERLNGLLELAEKRVCICTIWTNCFKY